MIIFREMPESRDENARRYSRARTRFNGTRRNTKWVLRLFLIPFFAPAFWRGAFFLSKMKKGVCAPDNLYFWKGDKMKIKRSKLMENSPKLSQMKEIAERIVKLRGNKSVNYVVSQLQCRGISISRSNYVKMEKAEIMFREDIILALSEIFEVPYEYICTGKCVEDDLFENLENILHKLHQLLSDIEEFIARLNRSHHEN